MLKILLATCETALREFGAAENAVSADLVADLERIAVRVRGELDALRR